MAQVPMPIHDWSRVDANLFHDFHQTWTVGICNTLNDGLLPKTYSALIEQHDAGVVSDVLALQRRGCQEVLAARGNRIAIHRPLGHVICAIEIVSPGNKANRAALHAFVEKVVGFLRHGVNLLVVDLFPPSVRDPQGIHKAIWDEIEEEPFHLPPDKQLTLAAYVADAPKVTYIEPVGVGDAMPSMPAYLDPDNYVPVPLEATYQAAWARCPEIMRDAVEQGEPLADETAQE